MAKRSATSKLKDALDKAWSIAVRTRDGFKCVMCGRTENLAAHHWIARRARSLATRWLLDNGATLCYQCHICRIHRESDKEFVDEFFNRMTLKVPKSLQDTIIDLSHQQVKFTTEDLRVLLARFNDARETDGRESAGRTI